MLNSTEKWELQLILDKAQGGANYVPADRFKDELRRAGYEIRKINATDNS